MNTYEVLIIFKPILDIDTSDNALRSVETTVANLKGKILKKDKQGRKRLAYEIGKFKDGFVTALVVSLEGENLEAFRRACSLNEDILRFVILRRDDYFEMEAAMAAIAASRPEHTREREFGGRDREFGGRDREHGGRDRGDRDFGRRDR